MNIDDQHRNTNTMNDKDHLVRQLTRGVVKPICLQCQDFERALDPTARGARYMWGLKKFLLFTFVGVILRHFDFTGVCKKSLPTD